MSCKGSLSKLSLFGPAKMRQMGDLVAAYCCLKAGGKDGRAKVFSLVANDIKRVQSPELLFGRFMLEVSTNLFPRDSPQRGGKSPFFGVFKPQISKDTDLLLATVLLQLGD